MVQHPPGVLGMRVFGEKPWAVLGVNPQIPASILKSVPYAPTYTPFKEYLDY